MSKQFFLPTIAYSAIDAINRVAAGQGSVRYAMATAHADYNGHHVRVYFNAYRQYWLAEYQWGERVVLNRGSLMNCIAAAMQEYKRGALGTTVSFSIQTEDAFGKAPVVSDEEIEAIKKLGFQEGSEDITKLDWWTWKHEEACSAYRLETQGFAAISKLIKAETKEEYLAALYRKEVAA